jgi:hypothetical protein
MITISQVFRLRMFTPSIHKNTSLGLALRDYTTEQMPQSGKWRLNPVKNADFGSDPSDSLAVVTRRGGAL